MLEQPADPHPTPKVSKKRGRGLIPLIAAGFVLVIVALLLLNWPSGQWGDDNNTMLPQISRTEEAIRGLVALPKPRLALDIGIYLVVAIGVGFLVAAWRGSRGAVVGLLVVGILGLSYVSNSALYIGPMISTCGFLLILFGGLVAWVTLPRHNLTEESTPPIDDKGTDEYASHPVA